MFGFDGFGLLAYAGTIWIIIDWVIRLTAPFFVPRNRKPSSGTSWLMVIFLFPIGGLILYKILGSHRLTKSRRDAQKTLDGIIKKTVTDFKQNHPEQHSLNVRVPEKYEAAASLSESFSHLPPLGGNQLELLSEYDAAIARIIRDINAAKHFIHIEYFIIVLDDTTEPLFAALADARKRGVQVRVMYDWLSARRYPGFKHMIKRLKQDDVTVQSMLPLRIIGRGYVRPDLRNHRKLVIIDGEIGYTGSQNLVQRNYHRKDNLYYDELVVRMRGPVVLELAAVFMTDWYSETGKLLTNQELGVRPAHIGIHGASIAQVLPSGPGYDDENNLKLFTLLIHSARKRITIVNPYFVPDEALMTALTSAARRGVVVTMVNSEAKDQLLVGHAQRSFYQELLEAGIKIYLYKAPILLHSKFMIIDDGAATIGSSNMDIRSFTLNLEVTLVSYDASVVKQLDALTAKYIARSLQVHLSEWRRRPQRKILLDNLARLTSALQ
jgi:cardiolipin synthase A/B